MAGENRNSLPLVIPSLSIFLSFIFPQAYTNMNLIEKHFHFAEFTYKTAGHN
jgi:hypothetical protein